MTVRARSAAGGLFMVIVAAMVSACTGGGSNGTSSSQSSTGSGATTVSTSTSTSSATSTGTTAASPVYVPIPGLNGTSLIAQLRTRLGKDATQQRQTGSVPANQAAVFLYTSAKLKGPGAFTVYVGRQNESIVYSVVCDDLRATLGKVGPLVRHCTDLTIPGVDNARVRSWVAAHRTGGKATTLTVGRASYYFTYDADHTMTLIVSYLGTAG